MAPHLTFLFPYPEKHLKFNLLKRASSFRIAGVYKILLQSPEKMISKNKQESLKKIFDNYPRSYQLPKIRISVANWTPREINKTNHTGRTSRGLKKYSMFYGRIQRDMRHKLLNCPQYSLAVTI